MGDPDRAAAYYERAYALRQDEFMRTLLASTARATARRRRRPGPLVAAIGRVAAPGTTSPVRTLWLGDVERALDLLEIELRLGHATDESRDKQKVWAAEDPDLAALRDSPRFRRLVAVR